MVFLLCGLVDIVDLIVPRIDRYLMLLLLLLFYSEGKN